MGAHVVASTAREVSVSLTESDIGTLYVIQRELLASPSVDFAGVIVKHPLTNECWMRVSTTKGNPLGEMERAAAAALKSAAEIRAALPAAAGQAR